MAGTGPRSSRRAVSSMLELVGAPAPEAPTAVDMDVAGVLEAIDCIVACATDDEAAVRGLLDDLADLGLAPKLISGVEVGVEALRDAIFEQVDGGLVVLCASDSIGRVQARRLAEVFNLHHAASQQLLVAGVDRRVPGALLSPIRRATNEYRQRRGAAPLGTPGLKGSGDCCAVSGSALSFDDAAPSDDALRDMASVVLDSRLRDEVGVIPETIVFSAVRRSHKRPGVPDPDAERPTLELLPVLTPVSEDDDADLDVEDGSGSGSPTTHLPPDPRRAGSRRKLWGRWVGLSGGVLMAAVTAVVLLLGEPSPNTNQTSVAAPELSLRKAQPISTARASSPSEEVTKPIEAEPLAEPTVLPSPDADLEAVAADGRIYGLAEFFATKPYATPSAWRVAANRCRSRSVEGIRGWRLPKPAELRALWRSDRVRDAVYWSGAKAIKAQTPSNWALDGRAGVLTRREKADSAATICVRSRLLDGRSQSERNPDREP